MKDYIDKYILQQTSIAPLIVFRILFGLVMCIGAIRFVINGWIQELYVIPKFHFKFYGFEWVNLPSELGMYILFGLIILSSFLVALGLLYRISIIIFFLSFSYVELIDATNYLNHYYLAYLLAFLLIFLPANGSFALDNMFNIQKKISRIPSWCINILILQLTVVYTFAGIAKLNSDWMLNAMPLSIWLPEHQNFPVFGELFKYKLTAKLFSWGGAFYDLTIAYFLMWGRTRNIAYFAVIGFHLATGALFNIGLFPVIMITSTLIFFPSTFHESLLRKLGWKNIEGDYSFGSFARKSLSILFAAYIVVQLILPLRHLAYPGDLLWTEEGYRFSWRVMLVEKIGYCTFFIEDSNSNRKQEVVNGSYLTKFQEKNMAIQPDFILQFAHFLKKEFEHKHGFVNSKITVDAHVAMNGKISQRFINPDTNLAEQTDGFLPKKWILPRNN